MGFLKFIVIILLSGDPGIGVIPGPSPVQQPHPLGLPVGPDTDHLVETRFPSKLIQQGNIANNISVPRHGQHLLFHQRVKDGVQPPEFLRVVEDHPRHRGAVDAVFRGGYARSPS